MKTKLSINLRKTLALLTAFAAFTVFLLPVFAEEDRTTVAQLLSDEGNLFSDSEKIYLSEKLEALSDKTGISVAIATVTYNRGKSDYDLAEEIYDEMGLGDQGILMLLCITHISGGNFVYILPKGSAEYYITRDELDRMLNAVEEDLIAGLSDDDFIEACETFIARTNSYITNYEYADDVDITGRKSFDFGGALIRGLIIGFIIAGIAVMIMHSKLKSVRPERSAANYVRTGSFELTEAREYYLYHRVTRVPKPRDGESGSHGGGSRGGGSSHGGGGRHF